MVQIDPPLLQQISGRLVSHPLLAEMIQVPYVGKGVLCGVFVYIIRINKYHKYVTIKSQKMLWPKKPTTK
jgi:D-alanine-D-alanine ligase-like ATP-grasp enzyme